MRIEIEVNGEKRVFARESFSVEALLRELGLAGRPVALAQNGEVIPRSSHEAVFVRTGDKIDIVHAVGGG